MAVRLVGETDGRIKLKAPVDEPEPAPQPDAVLAARIEAVGLLTALAAIVTARLLLGLAIIFAAALTGYAVFVHNITSVAGATSFDILVVIPLISLALRKG